MKQTLHYQNPLFQTLLQKNIDGVIVFDKDCRIVNWNEAMERLSGFNSEQAIGKNLFEVCTFMKQIDEFAFISRVLKGEEALSKNRPFLFPASNVQGYFEGNYFPVMNDFGQVEQVVCLFRDCTEKTLIDENLLTLTEKLRLKLLERTDQLVKANIDLKEEVRRRKRFGYEALLKNIELTDSIMYAKEIQQAILPNHSAMQAAFEDMFIFFKPRDIVSGDFYWFHKQDNFAYLAAVDCTGHGVPGALISILGYNALNQAVNEHHLTKPSDILAYLNSSVSEVFHTSKGAVRDGMDISLIRYDTTTRKLDFAGAFNPLFIVRSNGELQKIKGDRYPIGPVPGVDIKTFTNHQLQLDRGDCFYIFSDGYADQFGGDQGKKMKYSLFKNLLQQNHHRSMLDQAEIIDRNIRYWMGELEQVDDMLVIGVRVD